MITLSYFQLGLCAAGIACVWAGAYYHGYRVGRRTVHRLYGNWVER